jgi:hypothetical protein
MSKLYLQLRPARKIINIKFYNKGKGKEKIKLESNDLTNKHQQYIPKEKTKLCNIEM